MDKFRSILLKKLIFLFFDQKSILTSRVSVWSKYNFLYFSSKILFETSRNYFCFHLGRKLELSIFRQKFDSFIFRPKFDFDLWDYFCANFGRYIELSIFDIQVHFWSKNLVFLFSTKNRFETCGDHLWANFGRKIQLSIFDHRGQFLVEN